MLLLMVKDYRHNNSKYPASIQVSIAVAGSLVRNWWILLLPATAEATSTFQLNKRHASSQFS